MSRTQTRSSPLVNTSWDYLKFWSTTWASRLKERISLEYRTKDIVPPYPLVFRALENTSFEDVRVVILGQDPYPGAGLAHGLSFSIPSSAPVPPSLYRIFDEYVRDLGFPRPRTGNLSEWSKRGVLLLNATLTCVKGKSASHRGIGWEHLCREIIATLSSDSTHPIVFILWGNDAKEYAPCIDTTRHLVITSAHPSPLAKAGAARSSATPFDGSKPFSRTCTFLGLPKDFWRL